MPIKIPNVRSPIDESDLTEIQKFLESVSWGDSCEVCYSLKNFRAYLHCRLYILVPCHWSKFEQDCDRIIEIAERFHTRPGVIFYGGAPEYDCHRLTYEAYKKKLVVNWNGTENRLDHSQFIVRGLDSIEWWNPENWKVQA